MIGALVIILDFIRGSTGNLIEGDGGVSIEIRIPREFSFFPSS